MKEWQLFYRFVTNLFAMSWSIYGNDWLFSCGRCELPAKFACFCWDKETALFVILILFSFSLEEDK